MNGDDSSEFGSDSDEQPIDFCAELDKLNESKIHMRTKR